MVTTWYGWIARRGKVTVFSLEHAKNVADIVVARLLPFCRRIVVCGSVRREKRFVKDIDLVAFCDNRSRLGIELVHLTGQKLKVTGQIVRFKHHGLPVDLYLVEDENFAIVALIRTGSAEHNRWLAERAQRMGRPLNFAQGVQRGNGYVCPVITDDMTLEQAEEQIFASFGLPYIPPPQRELGAPHTRKG